MKTIVITGASSGIGKATGEYFAAQGWMVAATMRNPQAAEAQHQNIKLYPLDVTDEASVQAATNSILSDFSTVDVVLNNAGYGLYGPFEAASVEKIKRQFDTNVFGLMSVTRSFLPHFRANGTGMFVNVSSIGGLVTLPLVSLYHSTKWAVEGFSESLSYELHELGIKVKIIEPGAIETDFGGRSLDFATQDGLTAYDDLITRFRAARERMMSTRSPATLVAEVIYNAVHDDSDRLRYLVGADAEQMYATRQQAGADGFVTNIRQMIFGRGDAE